jgi:hypothetical protein
MVLPPGGLNEPRMGCPKAVQPVCVEEATSSHPLLECRQHAVRPNTRVRPVADRRRLSGRGSRERHFRRFRVGFPRFGHHASIFLHPFAPPALPGFLATMGALTPGRSALRVLMRDNEHRPGARPGLLVSCIKPSRRSTSNHLLPPPGPGLVLARSLPRDTVLHRSHPSWGLGVVWASPYLAGWPRQPAESSLSSCGPVIHLQLLSTPSHEDAVSFGYKVQTQL